MTAPVPTAGRLALLAALGALLCGAAPVAPEPAAQEVTKEERAGLGYLHRHAVKLFIDQTGFGFARLEPPLTDVLNPPKTRGDAAGTRQPVGPDAVAIRPGKDGKAAHYSFAKAVSAGVFVPSPAPKKYWAVKDVQLVGLVKHPEPVVYLGGGASMVNGAKEKTRRPDAFEARALEVIRGGGELLQAEKVGATMRAVSGIYAGRQCLKCHERPGEMLGAFSYRLAVEDAPASGTVLP